MVCRPPRSTLLPKCVHACIGPCISTLHPALSFITLHVMAWRVRMYRLLHFVGLAPHVQ